MKAFTTGVTAKRFKKMSSGNLFANRNYTTVIFGAVFFRIVASAVKRPTRHGDSKNPCRQKVRDHTPSNHLFAILGTFQLATLGVAAEKPTCNA